MSRNKDIKFLHDISGKSYKECRQIMKASGWDLIKALQITDILPTIERIAKQATAVIQDLADRIAQIMPAVVEIINNSMDSLIRAIKAQEIKKDVYTDDRRSEDPGGNLQEP